MAIPLLKEEGIGSIIHENPYCILHYTFIVNSLIKPDKKIPMFRVTRPYHNLLVKTRIFFRFS